MRKLSLLLCILTLTLLALSCGDGGEGSNPRPVIAAHIFSDQPSDGDIAFDPFLQSFTITNGTETLFFGIDTLDPNFPEYRAFLDFPLDGSTGGDVIPANAGIVSATLEVFVNKLSFASAVPTLLDLVSYPITGLRLEDFDSSALLSQSLNFFLVDLGTIVSIDITPLMREAQRLGLENLQLRFVLDSGTNFGLVGVENLPSVSSRTPHLTVSYVS